MAKNDKDPLDTDPVAPKAKNEIVFRKRPEPVAPAKAKVALLANTKANVEKFGYFEGSNQQEPERAHPDFPEDKTKMLTKRPGAYVNRQGVIFQQGFRFDGGHVCWQGNVVLNRCPRCGHNQAISDALKGTCANTQAGPDRKATCGYSAIEDLEKFDVE